MGIVEKLSLGLGAKLEGNSFDTQKDDKAKVKVEKSTVDGLSVVLCFLLLTIVVMRFWF